MPTRYATDEPGYGRDSRRVRTERDTRDVRETRDTREPLREVRMTDRREVDPRQAMRHAVPEPEMLRPETKTANSGAPLRQDPRTARNVPPPPPLRERELERERDRDQDMDMYDARPAPYPPVREVREVRETRRAPYDGEFDDMPARMRPVIDPGRNRDESRPSYNEYFLPGEGIDREVIQSEICRYLGQDATCKPGTHDDGRRGYIIRAYRALTTAMINSLREDSEKYAREKESAARRNRQPASFATYRDQTRYGGDDIVMDEPEDRYLSRHQDDPRLRAPVVTSAYAPEPGYPAYYPVGNAQPPPPGVDPRYVPGNTTPPTSRIAAGYPAQPAPGYPPVAVRHAAAPVPAAGYTDPRGNPIRDPGYGYQPDPRSRHR